MNVWMALTIYSIGLVIGFITGGYYISVRIEKGDEL